MYLWFCVVSSVSKFFCICVSEKHKKLKKRCAQNGKNDGFVKNAFLILSHKGKIALSENGRRARPLFCEKNNPLLLKTEEKNS